MKTEHLVQNGHAVELGKLSLVRRLARFINSRLVSVATPVGEGSQKLNVAVRNSYPIGSAASKLLERHDRTMAQRDVSHGLIGTVEYERPADGSRIQVGVPTTAHLETLSNQSAQQGLDKVAGLGPQESGEYMIDGDYVYRGMNPLPSEPLPSRPKQTSPTPQPLAGVPPHLQ